MILTGGKRNTSRSAIRRTEKEINRLGPNLQLTFAGREFRSPALETSVQGSAAPKAMQFEDRQAGISVVWTTLSGECSKCVLLTNCLIGNAGLSFSLGYGTCLKLVHL